MLAPMITRPANGNFTAMVERNACECPDKLALVMPSAWDETGTTEAVQLTYAQLWRRVRQFMAGLQANGIGEGDRVLLAIPLSADVYALTLALLASGAAGILVDASMGRKKVKQAVAASRAKAVVSVNALLKYRWFVGAIRRIPLKFSADKAGWGVRSIDQLTLDPDGAGATIPRDTQDAALITFTSGSTGQPKGADRTHGLLIEQVMTLPVMYTVEEDHVNFPAFPVASLAGLCLGVTIVLPPMSFARPDAVNPAAVVNEMRKWDVHNLSGPPSYIQRLAQYVIDHEVDFVPRQLAVGGAPVSRELCSLLVKAFPNTECIIVYGSTEAEPMGRIDVREVLSRDEQAYPAGRPAVVATIALAALPELAPPLDDAGIEPFRVSAGDIGEVIVSGDHVNRRYVDNDDATRRAKLFEVDGTVWHRTGDLAYEDDEGLMWLVGRHSYAIERDDGLVHPFPIEIALNALPQVERSALVATRRHPRGIVAILATSRQADTLEAKRSAREVLASFGLDDLEVRFVDAMPVDGRHNSKVDRVSMRAQLN